MKFSITIAAVFAASISQVSAWNCIKGMAQTGPSWAGYCLPNDADRAAGGMTQYCSGHSKCGTEGNGCIPNVQNYKGTWIANCGG